MSLYLPPLFSSPLLLFAALFPFSFCFSSSLWSLSSPSLLALILRSASCLLSLCLSSSSSSSSSSFSPPLSLLLLSHSSPLLLSSTALLLPFFPPPLSFSLISYSLAAWER